MQPVVGESQDSNSNCPLYHSIYIHIHRESSQPENRCKHVGNLEPFYSISISLKESSMASSKNCSTSFSSLRPNIKHPSNETLICYWIYSFKGPFLVIMCLLFFWGGIFLHFSWLQHTPTIIRWSSHSMTGFIFKPKARILIYLLIFSSQSSKSVTNMI